MLNPEGLAAFAGIVVSRGFSRAADDLGVAQSVLSKRLRRLEDQVGASLIDRSVRGEITLTRVGRLLLPDAQAMLAQLKRTTRVARNLARGRSGPLRIGFIFSAALNGTLGVLLNGLAEALPELELQPRMMETPEQLAALESGRLDIALVRPRFAYGTGCDSRVIHHEPLKLCLSPAHPLATKAVIAPGDLEDETFIIPQFHESVGLIDSIRSLAGVGGFAMPAILRTGDFVTAALLAAAGKGVVLAPDSLGRLGLDAVTFRELAGFDDRIKTVLVHHAQAPIEAVNVALDLYD